jgi:hypothetical protein
MLATDLPPNAYPRDEQMQSDMSEYREVLEPDLCKKDREILNAVREARMSSGNSRGITLRTVAEDGLQLLSSYADLLHDQCVMVPQLGDAERSSGGDTRTSPKQVCVDALQMLIHFAETILHWLSSVPQFLQQNVATFNVLVWIAVFESMHRIARWFLAFGFPLVARYLCGITSVLLLRCYYALLLCMSSNKDSRCPVLSDLRLRVASVIKGIQNPAQMRPPMVAMVLLGRMMLLSHVVFSSLPIVMLPGPESACTPGVVRSGEHLSQ